ncbi:MAG: hypothetical protein JWO88_3518 [Frankiales bacterium]|nr:hypothetical protein [Frankiales bacterium]
MHAVIVDVTIKDQEAGLETLKTQIVPMVSGSPGFVAGYWLDALDSGGHSMTLWKDEASANAAAEMVRGMPPGAPVTIDSVTVRGVAASA